MGREGYKTLEHCSGKSGNESPLSLISYKKYPLPLISYKTTPSSLISYKTIPLSLTSCKKSPLSLISCKISPSSLISHKISPSSLISHKISPPSLISYKTQLDAHKTYLYTINLQFQPAVECREHRKEEENELESVSGPHLQMAEKKKLQETSSFMHCCFSI